MILSIPVPTVLPLFSSIGSSADASPFYPDPDPYPVTLLQITTPAPTSSTTLGVLYLSLVPSMSTPV